MRPCERQGFDLDPGASPGTNRPEKVDFTSHWRGRAQQMVMASSLGMAMRVGLSYSHILRQLQQQSLDGPGSLQCGGKVLLLQFGVRKMLMVGTRSRLLRA